jgi:glutaredoxin
MSRICPKCNYVRKAADSCPAWQCPSCQVAYDKVGAAQNATYGRHSAAIHAAGTPAGGTLKWVLVFAFAAAGIWFARPWWQHHPSTQAKAAAEQPAVTLYSTEWCGYCAATRKFFDANGIRFEELDVEKTTSGYEGHKKLGGNGVPLIVVGDDVIHGYNEPALRDSLQPWLAKF